MQLIIVESPTKAKTIEKFLDKNFKIVASFGHIRDLPKGEFGIDIENNFKPKYVIPLKSRKKVNLLKRATKEANLVILATDPDREGEAISWHLKEVLNLKNYQRIVFHEITKNAILEALEKPRDIDLNLVNAQQARRILDRIVGYKLSPFLWKKIAKKLSAGRVQSVAVRLIVNREREIQNFVPQEYWQIKVLLEKIKTESENLEIGKFEAILVKKNNKIIPKSEIKNKKEVEKILTDLKGEKYYKVINIQKKEIKRSPLPPFITSTLQQEAWQKFHFPAKLTMKLAQNLYERGYITYHRTDSLNLSSFALNSAKDFIIKNYGENYYQFRQFKTKSKVAQEAHEAIRPTALQNEPGKLSKKIDKESLKLYELIWKRFVASQMAQSVFDFTKVEIEAKNKKYIFQASGSVLKFDGFLKIYPLKYQETQLQNLEINENLKLVKILPSQHFTQPPARYTEATLIKELEKNGIGRPSTYAPILSIIQERNYIEKDKEKRLKPTEIGVLVNDLLVTHFPEIVDINFTAKMEEKLDNIAKGKENWQEVIRNFYIPFEENLKNKYLTVQKENLLEKTDKKCPKCGAELVIRISKYGKFYACSNFPECKYTEPLEKNKLKIKCPKCKTGDIVEKRTKSKKIFYGCSNWPNCDFALWEKPTGKVCPKCGSLLVQKNKNEIKCSNPQCNFTEKLKNS